MSIRAAFTRLLSMFRRRQLDADLDDAWFVVAGSGDTTVDAAVLAGCDAARVWCLDASAAGGGSGTRA